MDITDITVVSKCINKDFVSDYTVTSNHSDIDGKLITLIELLNIGIKGDIKINRVYTIQFNDKLHQHINFNINNWCVNIYVAKAESINTNGINSKDTYDSISMKHENKVFTFSFVKDGIVKDITIKNCTYLAILFNTHMKSLKNK